MDYNQDLMEQFYKVNRLMHHGNKKEGKECGGSCKGQGRVLSLLKKNPHMTQKELSELLEIRSQSLGELLVRLERNGCIIRTISNSDRRVMNITLTAEGVQAAQQAEENRKRSARLFECLSEEEKESLHHILDRLREELEKE